MTYCESCEADRLWEAEGIPPVWASPTHTCDPVPCSEECDWCGENMPAPRTSDLGADHG